MVVLARPLPHAQHQADLGKRCGHVVFERVCICV